MEKSKFLRLLVYSDIVVLIGYIFFRSEVLEFLLATSGAIIRTQDFAEYQYLVWGTVLFLLCAIFSYSRQQYFSISPAISKGVLAFELMVLSAVVIVVWNSLSESEEIDPRWILQISMWSYIFEIVTTAGAGYVLADALTRIRLMIGKY